MLPRRQIAPFRVCCAPAPPLLREPLRPPHPAWAWRSRWLLGVSLLPAWKSVDSSPCSSYPCFLNVRASASSGKPNGETAFHVLVTPPKPQWFQYEEGQAGRGAPGPQELNPAGLQTRQQEMRHGHTVLLPTLTFLPEDGRRRKKRISGGSGPDAELGVGNK